MSRLCADIHRKIGEFSLDVLIESDAARIGILGASGSGKSMTLRSIAGIEDVDSGRIEIDGRVLYDSEKRINLKPQKRNVGYMFQNYALFPTMTVQQNVMAGLKGSRADNQEKALRMLARFGMEDYVDRLPGELSGGQQQRVALARIMVTEPELILLDEPFSALDGYLRDHMQVEMMDMLEDYPGQVIMVSHSRDELYRFSEELFVVRDGKILRHDSTQSVFRDPRRVEVAKLTGCKNFSDAVVVDPHTIEATTWGLTLHFEKEVPNNIRHLGYRAHYFEPIWGEKQENCIRFDLAREDVLPFERNYYVNPEKEDSGGYDDLLCWFVQGEEQRVLEERGMPDYLKLKEEHILLLE
ncbi:MAG: ATP-binding cassette domain-containing protein [Clostridiales bacterium]|nr:ATP-binding cassette domain-containing protein [Clostridiales bacterium]